MAAAVSRDEFNNLQQRTETHLAFCVEDEERIDTLEADTETIHQRLRRAERTIQVLWRVLESRFYYDLHTADAAVHLEATKKPLVRLDSTMYAEPQRLGAASS